jgi:hypothetical protein
MKFNIKVEKQVDIKYLHVCAEVLYWEDATVDDQTDDEGDLIPCRRKNKWCPEIDIETGIITNWEKGKVADVHYKVCDSGSYYLIDSNNEPVLSIENNYVPRCLSPKGNGYGDYIIMDIDENGKIDGWKFTLSGFQEEDQEED